MQVSMDAQKSSESTQALMENRARRAVDDGFSASFASLNLGDPSVARRGGHAVAHQELGAPSSSFRLTTRGAALAPPPGFATNRQDLSCLGFVREKLPVSDDANQKYTMRSLGFTNGHPLGSGFQTELSELAGFPGDQGWNSDVPQALGFFPNYGRPVSWNNHGALCFSDTEENSPLLQNREVHPARQNCSSSRISIVGHPLHTQLEASLLEGPIDPVIISDLESSKRLTKLLGSGNPVIIQNILSGVLGSVYEIMKDKNGYQVFQKLLDVCDDTEKEAIVQSVTQEGNELVAVAKDYFGNRSAKKLITAFKRAPSLCERVTSVLSPGAFDLMAHRLGSDLIDHCFIHLRHEQCTFIYRAALEHFHRLVRDLRGCASVKNCLITARAPYRERLLNEVIESSSGLSRDPYGNYIVQFALSLEDPEVTARICSKIKEDLVGLSMQKFGSFVVQKCLRSSAREELLRVLVKCSNEELQKLAQNSYGNYVFQTAVEVPKAEQLRDELDCAIRRFPQALWSTLGAKHVLNSLKRVSAAKAGSG